MCKNGAASNDADVMPIAIADIEHANHHARIRTRPAGQRRQARQPYARGVSRRRAAIAALQEGAGRDDAGRRRSRLVKASGLRGRGGAGFPTRAEVDVPAQGPSRPDLHVRQRRRERAGHVQQPHPDGARSASGARRDHPRLLRHAGDARPTSTCATNTRCRYERLQAGDRRVLRRRATWARTSSAASSRSTSTCIAARRRTSAAKRRG